MISPDEAARIADRWVGERAPGGVAKVHEFDIGYVVSAQQPPGAQPLFGQGCGVIDKDTAELSAWPPVPVDEVAARYRARQARRPSTVRAWDEAEQARWYMEHLAWPSTVTDLGTTSTLTNEQISVRSVKGDQFPRHHRLVVDFMHNGLAAAHRVRGYERCSEAAAVSDVLHAEDARRRVYREPRITLDEARTQLFEGVGVVTYRLLELPDPLAGQTRRIAARACCCSAISGSTWTRSRRCPLPGRTRPRSCAMPAGRRDGAPTPRR